MTISRREAEAVVLAITKKKNIDYKRPEGTPAVWQDRDCYGCYLTDQVTIDLGILRAVAWPEYLARDDYSECRFSEVNLYGGDRDEPCSCDDIRIINNNLHIEFSDKAHLTIPLSEEFQQYRTFYCDSCGEKKCTLVSRFEVNNEEFDSKFPPCSRAKRVWKFAHMGQTTREDWEGIE